MNEESQERLENIQGVEPILGALRMIALGSWQMAQKRRRSLEVYREHLVRLLPQVAVHLKAAELESEEAAAEKNSPQRMIVVVIGSERGLCGRFNSNLVAYTAERLTWWEKQEVETEIELVAVGGRIHQPLEKIQPVTAAYALPTAALPPLSLSLSLTQEWFGRLKAGEIEGVEVIFNQYEGVGRYRPLVRRVLPVELPDVEAREVWPPPIIETEPLALYKTIVEQWVGSALYFLLLESATAEHSARYQLLEAAKQNADGLIEELTTAVQMARQQAITREMQELAVGAGLT